MAPLTANHAATAEGVHPHRTLLPHVMVYEAGGLYTATVVFVPGRQGLFSKEAVSETGDSIIGALQKLLERTEDEVKNHTY
ncbi:hypothetical protein SCUCBS95973_002561 [Sporothrix curviconia]|uniref:Uncharacterized protein n=1 Tax=Sporothrix curviconia TaxID=1260050 RepID=A0ABP0B7Y1_9PEZI